MMTRWRCLGQEGVSCRLAFFFFVDYLFFFSFSSFVCLPGGCAWVRAGACGERRGGLGWDYHFLFLFSNVFFCIVCLFAVVFWFVFRCDVTISTKRRRRAGCVVVMTLGVVFVRCRAVWFEGEGAVNKRCNVLYVIFEEIFYFVTIPPRE